MVWYSHLYKNFPQFVVIHPIKCFGVVNKAAADTTERLQFHFSLLCIEEGNGNPLQCSCLENPKDEGAWWAAVYGVAQSRTRLKRFSSSSSSSRGVDMDLLISVTSFKSGLDALLISLLISPKIKKSCMFVFYFDFLKFYFHPLEYLPNSGSTRK